MKTTNKSLLWITLALSALSFLPSWAGPPRLDAYSREGLKRRLPQTAQVEGQILLDSGGFVNVLVGSPPPPRIGPFPASLRIYSRRTNQFVETVAADAEGRFEIKLLPGEYRIIPDLMQNNRVVAPGDAPGVVVAGTYEAAPPLEISVKPNDHLLVTILYKIARGS